MDNKTVSINRKANHEYFILETYEAGIQLKGTEVKSIREGKANIKDSFALIKNDEVFLHNMHISPYHHGNRFNHDPLRTRKLLLHKKEIIKLIGQTTQKGLTLIPLKLYFNKRGMAKVVIGLCKGKKMYDKRETLKRKDQMREIERAFSDNKKK